MLPAFCMKPGQLVPNWKLIVMPDTTPMANDSAKILTQSRYATLSHASPVRSMRTRRYTSTQARAMVMLGNRIWKAMFSPNWARARRSGSANMGLGVGQDDTL